MYRLVSLLLASLYLARALPVQLDDVTNVCDLQYNYCPRDPGCSTYTMSVHNVQVRDLNTNTDIKISNVTVGSTFALTVTGKTTMTQVPVSGSYRLYALTGGNVGTGLLTDALTLGANGSFTMQVQFNVAANNFGSSRDLFEVGLDVFQKASGSDEGMCVQIESTEYVKEAQAKSSPAFDLLCKDDGDGHFEKLENPVAMPVFDVTGATCGPPPPPPGCALDWYYCPRDPGCKTYTMSVETTEFDTHDSKGYKAGDKVTLIVKGTTSLTAIPPSGSYRIYALSGHNEGSGVLSDVMALSAGSFTVTVPFTLSSESFSGTDFEFGLDVFQGASGSDEGMCIEVANPSYVAEVKAKPTPPFVTYCKDEGHGHFVSTLPSGTPEVVKPVKCVL
eukprot:TRINITY_DN23722_c0_g1_i7.p1 TRINITY_DN23722_c0_g1~~TRINITY_DN23722_c0_g1_i7.p1  ORF type:complete len:390 (-),score=94.03 TRINITY_DN23722_c0_g1_i7:443-1612(-)